MNWNGTPGCLLECWGFSLLVRVLVTCVRSVCGSPLSCGLVMCAFFLNVCYTSLQKKKVWYSHYQPHTLSKNSLAQWKIFMECCESYFGKTNIFSHVNKNKYLSIENVCYRNKHVWWENKNNISFGKHLLDWR